MSPPFSHYVWFKKAKSGHADCRLLVATVTRDYGLTERVEVPEDSRGIFEE